MTYNFHKSIIRAYDIRGIYNETLFDEDAFFLGKSFAKYLHQNNKKRVAIGFDGRKSSPILKEQLIKGLLESGIDVFDIGLGPTPMLYFAIYHLEVDAGIMITGSHNPKNHNGFKMALQNKPFFGDDIIALSKIAQNGNFVKGEGNLIEIDVEDKYVEKIISDCILGCDESILLDEIDEFEESKKYKIVWDAGNGAAGRVMKKIAQKINAQNFLLFEEIDGNFPNHHPDPTVEENLVDLKREILANKADIGLAFDGDGDRVGVVDDEGQVIWGDQLLIFYAREILEKNPGATIIADVKASDNLFSEIKKADGKAIMWKTGHSFIKAKMKEENALLAGEMSGHIFFADQYLSQKNHGYDDGLYAAIRILNILVKSNQKLSDLRKKLPKSISTAEIRIEVSEEEKFAIIDTLKAKLQKEKVEFNDVDGIRALNENGWWLIRASNTQAALVARCESNSKENLEKLKENLRNLLNLCEVKIPQELL